MHQPPSDPIPGHEVGETEPHPSSVQAVEAVEAVDASLSQRPGVPMENDPPEIVGAAHWIEPERQPDPGNVLKRKGLAELTPVFGTANPPRGISGVMRRAAYELPEHFTSHWLLLLAADRVDALEHGGARRLVPFALSVAALAGLAAFALTRPARRGRRSGLLAWLG